MARKTITQLLAQADTTLADNTGGDITAFDVRAMVKDIIDTFKPCFGIASNASVVLPAVGTTPVPIPLGTLCLVTPDFAVDLPNGIISRHSIGLPNTTTRITFFTELACPDGNEIVLSLYRNGS